MLQTTRTLKYNERLLKNWEKATKQCRVCGQVFNDEFRQSLILEKYPICEACKHFWITYLFAYLGHHVEAGTIIYSVLDDLGNIESLSAEELKKWYNIEDV
jgi:hypothetical protein